jgi:hypothetical protein
MACLDRRLQSGRKDRSAGFETEGCNSVRAGHHARARRRNLSDADGGRRRGRAGVGGVSAEAARAVGTAPVWLRLTRTGNRIAAFYTAAPDVSPDGHLYTWEPLGEVTLTMGSDIVIGLAVTSHAPGTLATAVFDDVVLVRQ